LKAEDPEKIPRKKEINTKDNHISFQARLIDFTSINSSVCSFN